MIANLADVQQSWNMTADGTYNKLGSENGEFSAHTYFMTNPSLSGRGRAIEGKQPLMPHLVSRLI
jgi:polyphosphate kinase